MIRSVLDSGGVRETLQYQLQNKFCNSLNLCQGGGMAKKDKGSSLKAVIDSS